MSAPTPGITIEERDLATVHIGGREELIAAGLAAAGEFPGSPGCGRTSTIFRRDGRKWKKVPRRSTYWWEVAFYKTREQQRAARAASEAEVERQRAEHFELEKSERAAADAELTRRALAEAGGARGLAHDALKAGMFAIFRAFNMTNDPAVPYAFDEQTIGSATEHCKALVALLDRAPLREKLAPLAQGDGGFQRFMGRAIGGR